MTKSSEQSFKTNQARKTSLRVKWAYAVWWSSKSILSNSLLELEMDLQLTSRSDNRFTGNKQLNTVVFIVISCARTAVELNLDPSLFSSVIKQRI